MTAIETEHLTKRYKKFAAVDGVSLQVREGEIYGFLGLNGAGKTTTMRMLLGMIRPNGGRAFVNGKEVGKSGVDMWADIGYLVESPSFYPELTVYENLDIARRLRALEKGAIERVLVLLNLGQYSDRKARDLSLGNGQRLALAKALIHRPKILILDEPVNGLDPEGIASVREMLAGLARAEGTSILVSSHLLDEVARIADRIGIIHRGKMLKETTVAELGMDLHRRLIVETGDNAAAERVLESMGFKVEREGPELSIAHRGASEDPASIATALVHAGLAPRKLLVEREELEAYFLRTIRKTEVGI